VLILLHLLHFSLVLLFLFLGPYFLFVYFSLILILFALTLPFLVNDSCFLDLLLKSVVLIINKTSFQESVTLLRIEERLLTLMNTGVFIHEVFESFVHCSSQSSSTDQQSLTDIFHFEFSFSKLLCFLGWSSIDTMKGAPFLLLNWHLFNYGDYKLDRFQIRDKNFLLIIRTLLRFFLFLFIKIGDSLKSLY